MTAKSSPTSRFAVSVPKAAAALPFDLSAAAFAMHDPIIASMPGLFRVLDEQLSPDDRTALRLKHTHGVWTVEVHSSQLLSGMTLAVLQAVVSLAASSGETIMPNASMQDGLDKKLVAGLAVAATGVPIAPKAAEGTPEAKAQHVVEQDVQHVSFAHTHLREALGLSDSKANRAMIDRELHKLAAVVLLVYPTKQPRAFMRLYLLAYVSTDVQSRRDARTHIALHPRLTQFVLGNMPQDARISLVEARQLGTSQPQRILHQRLCSWINDGAERAVSFKKLLEYVYPDDPETRQLDILRRERDRSFAKLSAETLQLTRMNEVLAELEQMADKLGWTLTLSSERARSKALDLRNGSLAVVDGAKQLADLDELQTELEADARDQNLLALRYDRYAMAQERSAALAPLNTVMMIKRKYAFLRPAKPAALSLR